MPENHALDILFLRNGIQLFPRFILKIKKFAAILFSRCLFHCRQALVLFVAVWFSLPKRLRGIVRANGGFGSESVVLLLGLFLFQIFFDTSQLVDRNALLNEFCYNLLG